MPPERTRQCRRGRQSLSRYLRWPAVLEYFFGSAIGIAVNLAFWSDGDADKLGPTVTRVMASLRHLYDEIVDDFQHGNLAGNSPARMDAISDIQRQRGVIEQLMVNARNEFGVLFSDPTPYRVLLTISLVALPRSREDRRWVAAMPQWGNAASVCAGVMGLGAAARRDRPAASSSLPGARSDLCGASLCLPAASSSLPGARSDLCGANLCLPAARCDRLAAGRSRSGVG